MRGIAALSVVLYHVLGEYIPRINGYSVYEAGAFGVDLFFIISGFIICYSTRALEKNMAGKYMIRRVFRIYPLLITVIVFFFYFMLKSSDYMGLIRAIVPLNADYGATPPFFGWNLFYPAWTLTYEIVFYGLFLLAFSVSHRYRGFIAAFIIIFLVFGIQLYAGEPLTFDVYKKLPFLEGNIWYAPLNLLASPIFLDFVLGIMLYILFAKIDHDFFRKNRLLINVSTSIFIIASLYLIITNTVYGHGPAKWGGLCALIMGSSLAMEKSNDFRKIKSLNFLGEISYSLYMTHVLVLYVAIHLLNPPYPGIKGIIVSLSLVGICLVVAMLTYSCVEKPGISIGRKLVRRLD